MRFVKGELEIMESGFGEVIDADIKYMLQSVTMLTRPTFANAVFEEGTDAIVLLYTTAYEDET
jgi:hypothetical protein